MAVEKTVELKVDAKDALKRLEQVEKQLEDIKDTNEKTEKSTSSLAKGFKGVGLAMKAAGFAIVQKVVDALTTALMKNQVVLDTVNTVVNSISVVFKLVTDAIVDTYEAVAKSSENFDALGNVVKNVLTISITPLKLAFLSIKLGIQAAMLAWEKSFLGGKGKDKERIAELTAEIDSTKQSIKDTGVAAIESAKEIKDNVGEAISEVVKIGEVATEQFKKTFEGVTVDSILEQGKAITETRKNYELLALQQQRLVEQFDIDAESQRAIRDDVSRSIEERIQANDRLGEVLKEQNLAEQEAVDAQIAALRQRIDLEGESVELSNEIFALETEKVAIQAKVKGFEAEQLTNINALKQEQKDLNQQLKEQELEKAAIVSGAMGQISQAIGENTKAGKALAIGQAIIDTYAGATKALAQGGIFGTIGAAGIIAAGLANVAKIKSTKLEGVQGTVGGTQTIDASLPTGGAIQGLGNLIPNLEGIQNVAVGETQPVQAFVVENDISNAQALQEELDIQATL